MYLFHLSFIKKNYKPHNILYDIEFVSDIQSPNYIFKHMYIHVNDKNFPCGFDIYGRRLDAKKCLYIHLATIFVYGCFNFKVFHTSLVEATHK